MSRHSIATSGLPLSGVSLPDASGHFDRFGGRFVPEALYAALLQLEREFHAAMADPAFQAELEKLKKVGAKPAPEFHPGRGRKSLKIKKESKETEEVAS